ncbi:MAG: hypothetical protein K6G84_15815 [Lachnospiraceae bacterium]|nr:hypothetical protein [Lachnospiraceae bacterium]
MKKLMLKRIKHGIADKSWDCFMYDTGTKKMLIFDILREYYDSEHRLL